MNRPQQVRRPLVGIALSVAAGLGIQHGFGGSPLLWLSAASFSLALAGWKIVRASPALYLSCGLLAGAYGAIASQPSSDGAALAAAEIVASEHELTGVIVDDPVVSDVDGSVSFLFRTESVRYEERTFFSRSAVRVYMDNPESGAQYGGQWRLCGRYTAYRTPREADGFFIVAPGGASQIRPAGTSFFGRCFSVRRRAAEILHTGVEGFPEQTQLLHALLLGYRQSISPELYQLFSRTGIMHIFAISGLHVGVMASILIAGLKLAGVSRPRWGWFLIPCLFLYVAATGMKASAMRAFTMAAVYFAAPLAGRKPDTPSSVALACLLLLAVHPAYIIDAGFLLSFIVVCGILMLHGWTERKIKWMQFSGWSAPLRRLNGPRPLDALLRSTGLLMLTSVAAWIFSVPVSAGFFHLLSPVSLIGNLAVIPLTFIIMLTGCLTLLGGSLFSPAAALFNQANLLFISLLIEIVRRLAGLPGACLAVLPPSSLSTGLWYAGWVILFCGPSRWWKSAVWILFLSVSLWVAGQKPDGDGIRVVRANRSVMAVRLPEKGWMLVTDGRPESAGSAVRLLRAEGAGKINSLLISGRRADAATVQQLQKIFKPAETRAVDGSAAVEWSSGGGTVRISSLR
jgi:ComEC/Rec2-related protein